MCGVFGFVGESGLDKDAIGVLVHHSEQRGRDSSGVMLLGEPMFGQELWVESSVTLILPIVVLALSWMTLRRTSDA